MHPNTLNPNAPGSRKHDSLAHLTGKSGVYYITDGTGRAYIGSTRDLGSRLRTHSTKYAGWTFGYRICALRDARCAEAALVRTMLQRGQTVLNANIPRAWKLFHPDVSRQLYHRRLQLGWSEELARSTPPKKYSRRKKV